MSADAHERPEGAPPPLPVAAPIAARPLRWEHVLAAAVLGLVCAKAAYLLLDLPLRYPAPIVGNPAWHLGNKFHDYAAPIALVAGFLAALAIVAALAKRLVARVGETGERELRELLLVACAPAALWVAGLLTTRVESTELVELAGGLVVAVLVLATALSRRGLGLRDAAAPGLGRLAGEALLAVLAVWVGVVSLGIAASRLLAAAHSGLELDKGHVQGAAAVAIAVAGIAIGVGVWRARSPEALERLLRRIIRGAQLAWPGLFFLLVPQPWRVNGRITIGYPVSRAGWLVVLALVLVALLSAARGIRSRAPVESPFDLLSATSVVGVILLLKTTPIGLPAISGDDYHWGEVLVPWWSLAHEKLLPFVDYTPVRGLVNYLPGAAASLLFDGKAPSFWAGAPFLYAAALLVALPPLRRSMNLGWAALALLFTPYLMLAGDIDLVVTAFLAAACHGFLTRPPTRWLVGWVVLGGLLLLYAPGQAGLALLATAPFALLRVIRARAVERRTFHRAAGALAAVALLVALVTPLGKVVLGAFRYGLEQSSVNSVAHAVPWSDTFRTGNANPWLWELMRASWLVVTAWAGVLVLRARSLPAEARRPVLVYAGCILAITTLFVVRAAGRIDAGPSRLGMASLWACGLLLPLMLYATSPRDRKGPALLAWVFLAGLTLPHLGGFPRFTDVFAPIPLEGVLSRGDDLGIPALGVASTDPAHVARLRNVRAVLDRVLDPGETYLDLTGRQAQYFYLERRPPIESGAAYNLVAEGQQRRAIAALRPHPPPAVLISADNLQHDGGPVSLRAPLLYRWVLELPAFKAVATNELVWLVREDRAARLAGGAAVRITPLDDAPASPLHAVLKPPTLDSIPASWGRSAGTLEPKMTLVRELDDRAGVAGADGSLRLDLGGALDGRDAGILAFDFHCERVPGALPRLQVHWTSAQHGESEAALLRLTGDEGHLLVPLDAAPAWLLARGIRSLRFDLAEPGACPSFRVERPKLYQRRGVEVGHRS